MRVQKLGGVPVKDWVAGDLEEKALEQAVNLSKLPFALKHIALMPDAHAGYGMPIGGVLFADRAVVPYAIGVDIGCGVTFASTDLIVDDFEVPGTLGRVLEHIGKHVPVGFNTHPEPQLLPDTLEEERYKVDTLLRPHGLDFDQWVGLASEQLGSLGGGNHFIELQRDDDGRIFVMLHSGSRSLGKRICDSFHKLALQENGRWHSQLPDRELAYLPAGTDLYRGYWKAMEFALRWAEENRRRMLEQVRLALHAFTPMSRFEQIVDVHHNYAAWENHFGKNGIVHRKGAVRAAKGETVLIPGSMGTASYVATGLGNPESFDTCQHGAGRAQTRTAMRKGMTSDQVFEQMEQLGVGFYSGDPEKAMEEAPSAYKDIEVVMAQSVDLVEPVMRLRPVGVVKG